jgi:hypothetical protein
VEGSPSDPKPKPPAEPRVEAPPPEAHDPEARPATLAEVRTLRRWLTVAGVWAVAASAIAVIALLEARREEEPKGPRAVTGTQLRGVQAGITERIDELETQIGQLPASADVRKLDRRLKRVEDAAADTRGDVRGLRGDLDDLSTRVDDVEQAQEDAAADDPENTETTETTP